MLSTCQKRAVLMEGHNGGLILKFYILFNASLQAIPLDFLGKSL